jgi:HlyD family secretion protein
VVALPAAAAGAYLLAHATGNRGDGGRLRLTGVVTANEVLVAAKTAGRIQQLPVQEGSWVKPGDLIALLDREELNAERRQQLALIEQLSARLRQAREVAVLEGDRGRGRVASAAAQLRVARSQRDEAAANQEQLRKDAERVRSLFAEGLVSRQEIERIDTDLRVSEARLKSLSEQVTRVQADLELARSYDQTGVSQRDVEQTQAQIEQAKAQLAQITARIEYTEVRAPLRGMVSVRVAREGEVIRLGDPIVTLVDLDDVWVRADVEESYMNRIVIGQTLKVELASGERLQGRVTFIEPEAQFATQRDVSRVKRDIRTFGIKVSLPNPDRRLHEGMTAYMLLPDHPAAPSTGS